MSHVCKNQYNNNVVHFVFMFGSNQPFQRNRKHVFFFFSNPIIFFFRCKLFIQIKKLDLVCIHGCEVLYLSQMKGHNNNHKHDTTRYIILIMHLICKPC